MAVKYVKVEDGPLEMISEVGTTAFAIWVWMRRYSSHKDFFILNASISTIAIGTGVSWPTAKNAIKKLCDAGLCIDDSPPGRNASAKGVYQLLSPAPKETLEASSIAPKETLEASSKADAADLRKQAAIRIEGRRIEEEHIKKKDTSLYSEPSETVSEDVPKPKKKSKPKKPKPKADYDRIFQAYVDADIISHRRVTDDMKSAIDRAVKKVKAMGYTDDPELEIVNAIRNYGRVNNGKRFFFNYKWTLIDFLDRSRGLSVFMDEAKPLQNFLHDKSKLEPEDKKEDKFSEIC